MSADNNGSRVVIASGEGHVFGRIAAVYVAEVANVDFTGQAFGIPVDSEGFAYGPDGIAAEKELIATAALQSLLARAYLAGRADQISDVHGDNTPRTVRARDLKGVIAMANSFNNDAQVDPKEVLPIFDSMRSLLGSIGLLIHTTKEGGSDRIMNVLEAEEAEIRFVTKLDNISADSKQNSQAATGVEAMK